MKKFLTNILVFSTCLLIVSYLGDLFLSLYVKKSNSHAQKEYPIWNDILGGTVNADLIVNGSSRAWVNVSPKLISEQLHVSSYNIGIDGHNFVLQNLRHHLLLKYNRKPKWIIHSLDLFTLEGTGGLYNPDQFLPYMLWNTDIKKTTLLYTGYSSYDFEIPLIRYCGKWDAVKTAAKLFVFPQSSPPERVNGYQGQEKVWNSDFDKAQQSMKSFKAKLNSETLALFENYLQDCASDSIKVILVYAPEYSEGQKFVPNRADIIAVFGALSKKYNLPFYDFSKDPICYDTRYFYNALHLNKTGSEIFTAQLGDSLKQHKVLN